MKRGKQVCAVENVLIVTYKKVPRDMKERKAVHCQAKFCVLDGIRRFGINALSELQKTGNVDILKFRI